MRWIADYVFTDTGRRVHNELRSTFVLKDGLIVQQHDQSDAWQWCMQALGPFGGRLAWHIPGFRKWRAGRKLDKFIERHPHYQ